MFKLWQNGNKPTFPIELKNLEGIDVTFHLLIKEVNVAIHAKLYWATSTCHGFYFPEEAVPQSTQTIQQSTSQVCIFSFPVHILLLHIQTQIYIYPYFAGYHFNIPHRWNVWTQLRMTSQRTRSDIHPNNKKFISTVVGSIGRNIYVTKASKTKPNYVI